MTALYLSRFLFFCHFPCGKEQLLSVKGGGKRELSIIKVFLTLSVVPNVSFPSQLCLLERHFGIF